VSRTLSKPAAEACRKTGVTWASADKLIEIIDGKDSENLLTSLAGSASNRLFIVQLEK
jgi:hypothetical protein